MNNRGTLGSRMDRADRIEFGLMGWLEQTRVRLPLQGVECRFQVCGEVASVEIDQVFFQSNRQPMNCTYTFPLPGGAAVYRCEVQIGSRTIHAKVEEEEKARELFKEKVHAGYRAGLVEMERENLFTLSLGNLQPNDRITVRFAWFQIVDRTGSQLSLMIPFCPGVRYIPGQPLWRESTGQGTELDTNEVPDASRISPPRIPAAHEDAALLQIEGTLDLAGIDAASVACPLHSILARRESEVLRIALQLGSAVPDRDFVLRWQEQPTPLTAGNAWMSGEEAGPWALVQLKAPEHAAVHEQYHQDVYFLVDRSGSMAGQKWVKTAEALQSFVRQLGEHDRVWITFFESTFADFAEKPWPAPALLRDRNFLSIEQRGVSGGTEMLPALRHILQKATEFSFNQKRPAVLVLITDGEIANEQAVLEAFRPYPSLRVHAFGIDLTVNDAFLRQLARQQRGAVTLQTPADDVARAVSSLGAKLRRPVLTDLELGAGWQAASDYLPDLYAGDVISIPLRQVQATAELTIKGRLPEGLGHSLALQPRPTKNPALRLVWMRDRIQYLLRDNKAEAIRLAIETNLICDGTAFIAWDPNDKVPIASATLYQPALEVHETMLCLRSPAKAYVGAVRRQFSLADEEAIHTVLLSKQGRKFVEALWKWASADAAQESQRQQLITELLDVVEAEVDAVRQKALCVKFVEEQVLQPRFEESLRLLFDNLRKTHAHLDSCRDLCKKFLRDLQADPAYELLELAKKLSL